MNDLSRLTVMLIFLVCIFLLVYGVPFLIYVFVRLGTKAYFKSRNEAEQSKGDCDEKEIKESKNRGC